MHIEEITIDGFKSYAQRVTVPAFDPQFNAITGLNGSGKSNILDSICFVLGITNLQRVRDTQECVGVNVVHAIRLYTRVCVHSLLGASQQPAGAHLQAGPGRCDQGICVYCIQQHRQDQVTRWLRAV